MNGNRWSGRVVAAVGVAVLCALASIARAEGISGSRKVDATVEQKAEVDGDQIAVAVGNRASAANINSAVVANEVSGNITQVTEVESQIAAAIGNQASAVNVNGSVVGSYGY